METRRRENVLILAPQGDMIGESETSDFAGAFREAMEKGESAVLVDLAGLRYANSTGLGALVAAHLKAREVGASMVLTGVSKRMAHILEVTRLSAVFSIAASEDEAIAALSRPG